MGYLYCRLAENWQSNLLPHFTAEKNLYQEDLVPLEEELAFVRPHLFLWEKRFGEKLLIQIDIPEKFLHLFNHPP